MRKYTDAVSVAIAFTQPASIAVQAMMPGLSGRYCHMVPPRNRFNQDCYSGCSVKPDNSKF